MQFLLQAYFTSLRVYLRHVRISNMVKTIFDKGKKLLMSPQTSVLSAATVIMVMLIAARVLGVVNKFVLAHYFELDQVSLFWAAFRLPDLIFEVFFFSTFSSAFIPVFTKALKRGEKDAWDIAGRVVNIALLIFIPLAIIVGLFAYQIYEIVAPGFDHDQTLKIANLARVLFAAQGLFIVSYIVTGVLESLRRFFVPALAPIFYNMGIILGTVLLTPYLGLFAPAVGAVIGAFLHLAIQIPLAFRLGFRFVPRIRPNEGVKKIGRLSAPRFVELSFQQIARTVELNLSSVISTVSYTYLVYANSLQALPVTLFGVSLAKAALPTLARLEDDRKEFLRTLLSTLYQIVFFVLPLATILIVLRVPVIRLTYGIANNFDWEATIQTGLVLSGYAFGVVFQSVVSLLSRAFYALHDTKTPVAIALVGVVTTISTGVVLVRGFGAGVWGLSLAFSLGVAIQSVILFFAIVRRIDGISLKTALYPISKHLFAAIMAGGTMFFILKFFDRSVWIKRLSFLSNPDLGSNVAFQNFVLDTRYSFNLLILTVIVASIGLFIYLGILYLLRCRELFVLVRLIKQKTFVLNAAKKEPVSTSPTDSAS